MLNLYSFFHLNLFYSSIPETEHEKVVERCYWPLLKTIDSAEWPCGIELSGWTLERINSLDQDWSQALHRLISKGLVKLIGSGYHQIVAPLAPHQINRKNLELGWSSYSDILGARPDLSLLPEQAYSASYADTLLDFGLRGMVMEWNNPYSANLDWDPFLQYSPQRARTASGRSLPVIWNNSLNFQKFQRFVHGQIDLEEYLAWLERHQEDYRQKFMPLYGSDAEIFNYRPGRFFAEPAFFSSDEWQRVSTLVLELQRLNGVELVGLDSVMAEVPPTNSAALSLETAEQPAPVKKQPKYNIVRWAVSGIDDFGLNSKCFELSDRVLTRRQTSVETWQELLGFWASDYRTHITNERWNSLWERIQRFESDLGNFVPPAYSAPRSGLIGSTARDFFTYKFSERQLAILSPTLSVALDLARGMSIKSWKHIASSDETLFGYLPAGLFDRIDRGVDYFSGHLTFSTSETGQITDLHPVQPEIHYENQDLIVSTRLSTPLGEIAKILRFEAGTDSVHVRYLTNFGGVPGSLRFGYVTILSNNPSRGDLAIRSHLGGENLETFVTGSNEIHHGLPVSPSVSASAGLPCSRGLIVAQNKVFRIDMELDESSRGALGMLEHHPHPSNSMTRVCFSAGEIDDTSKRSTRRTKEFGLRIFSTPL